MCCVYGYYFIYTLYTLYLYLYTEAYVFVAAKTEGKKNNFIEYRVVSTVV